MTFPEVCEFLGLVIMGVFCSVVSGAAAFAFILMVRSSFRDF